MKASSVSYLLVATATGVLHKAKCDVLVVQSDSKD